MDPNVSPTPAAAVDPGHPLTPREQALVAARETADRLRKRANECHTRQDYSRASNLYKEVCHPPLASTSKGCILRAGQAQLPFLPWP